MTDSAEESPAPQYSSENELLELDLKIREVLERSSEAWSAGNPARALHVLREFMNQKHASPIGEMSAKNGLVLTGMSPMWLLLSARETRLTIELGQWTDSAHGWLFLYEQANPLLPETHTELRIEMDLLRISAALDHENYYAALAWCLDLLELADEIGDRSDLREMALLNISICADAIGMKGTASGIVSSATTMEDPTPQLQRILAARAFEQGDVLAALDGYNRAIQYYRQVANPSVAALHHWVGTLRRRADCHLRVGDSTSAQIDVLEAWRLVERARGMANYQAARSADRTIRSELLELMALLTQIDGEKLDSRLIVEVLLRASNSSASASIRGVVQASSYPEVYLEGRAPGGKSVAALSRNWRQMSDSEISSALLPDTPTMFTCLVGRKNGRLVGITVLIRPRRHPTVRTWAVGHRCPVCGLEDCDPEWLLEDLLATPGEGESDSSAWELPPSRLRLSCLASLILPMAELEQVAESERALVVCPVDSMWGFPFGAMPLKGELLGTSLTLVYSTPLARNTPPASSPRWLGCFDLTLPFAVNDLSEYLGTGRRLNRTCELFDTLDEFGENVDAVKPSLIVLSCHGRGRGSRQEVLFAGGEAMGVDDVPVLPRGANVVLNACWVGGASDRLGVETINMPLVLLSAGAHGVIGALRPIEDEGASEFFALVIRALGRGESVGPATHGAWRQMEPLTANAPLSEWAAYLPISRAIGWPNASWSPDT